MIKVCRTIHRFFVAVAIIAAIAGLIGGPNTFDRAVHAQAYFQFNQELSDRLGRDQKNMPACRLEVVIPIPIDARVLLHDDPLLITRVDLIRWPQEGGPPVGGVPLQLVFLNGGRYLVDPFNHPRTAGDVHGALPNAMYKVDEVGNVYWLNDTGEGRVYNYLCDSGRRALDQYYKARWAVNDI